MFHATKGFQILCSALTQGALVMATIPVPNSGYGRATPISNATTASNSLAGILQYISAGWGTLTRTHSDKTYRDLAHRVVADGVNCSETRILISEHRIDIILVILI
jgi:hypothetical protein